MESHPLRPIKRPRFSRRLCNELVSEFCCAILMLKASDRILLTSANMHSYLVPRFRKMRSIYRDLIAFIKAKLKANEHFGIRIDQVKQNKESEPIVESNNEFVLEANQLRIRIENRSSSESRNAINILGNDGQLECAQLHHFLRLIAPLVQPIHLQFCLSSKPIKCLMPFLNAFSGLIDSIGLSPGQFNSAAIDGALAKCNKLQILSPLNVDVPKFIHWLTNGQSKKYLILGMPWMLEMKDSLNKLLNEIKKDFARATSQSSFVVRLKLFEPLSEFTMCNESTGEKLQLCRIGVKVEEFIYSLSRSPNNEMEKIDRDFAEFNPYKMTTIFL